MPSADYRARTIEDLIAFDLRAQWQSRCLMAAKDRCASVLLSVLAHNFDDQMEALLTVCFPGFVSIRAPFLSTAGRIQKSGAITADLVTETGQIVKNFVLYNNEIELRDEFRRLADHLKLNDDDRKGLFVAVQKWLVCDYRIDPTMDMNDPDRKRLVN